MSDKEQEGTLLGVEECGYREQAEKTDALLERFTSGIRVARCQVGLPEEPKDDDR